MSIVYQLSSSQLELAQLSSTQLDFLIILSGVAHINDLLNAIINMSGRTKQQFFGIFPTAHINDCLEQTSI